MHKKTKFQAMRLLSLAAACLILTCTVLTPVSARSFGFLGGLLSRFGNQPDGTKTAIRQIEANDYLNGYHGIPDANDWARLVVAVLYEDGTVKVVRRPESQVDFSAADSWKNIEKIWLSGTTLFGLDSSGRLYSTDKGYDTSKATNVTGLFFAEGVYASCKDGKTIHIPYNGATENANPTVLKWKNVEKTYYYHWQYPNWGVLMLSSDGTIASTGMDGLGKMEGLKNVRDIFMLNQTPAAVLKDGTLYFQEGIDPNLAGSVKLAADGYGPLYYGVTDDGQLKIGGDMGFYESVFSEPGYYIGTNAIPKSSVADVIGGSQGMRSGNVVILYKDGTVLSPVASLNQGIRNWKDIVQANWYEGYDHSILYALRKDGSVIAAKVDFSGAVVEVWENYQNWKLEKLYVKPFAGAIGVTKDGKVVGDLAFENLNFSALQ